MPAPLPSAPAVPDIANAAAPEMRSIKYFLFMVTSSRFSCVLIDLSEDVIGLLSFRGLLREGVQSQPRAKQAHQKPIYLPHLSHLRASRSIRYSADTPHGNYLVLHPHQYH